MKLLDNLMAVNVDDYPEDKITYDQTPIRMFKLDALEMFTHVTPQAILIIWLPVVAVFLYLGIASWPATQSPIWVPLMFVLGAVFALLWWGALRLGAKGDAAQAAFRAQAAEADDAAVGRSVEATPEGAERPDAVDPEAEGFGP